MKALLLVYCAALVLLAGCGKKNEQKAQPGENPLSAPADYLGAAVQAKVQAEKTIDLATVNSAIKMFHASEGRYPNSLQELVDSGYLSVVPRLPAGMKINYDPATGVVTVTKAH